MLLDHAGGDAAARMARRQVHVVPTRSPDISDPAGRSGDQQQQLPAGTRIEDLRRQSVLEGG